MASTADAPFTEEQLAAIERREGELLLDAGAGSGKTSVLVERFARAVVEDGVEVGAILAITFTEKAAAELRERIRARLIKLGAEVAAREAEGAFISTIHAFCARLLRAQALSAGIDPQFTVLDRPQAERLADRAFDDALEDLARQSAGTVELIASYGTGTLRGATISVYAELRSRGQLQPRLPALAPAPSTEGARERLKQAAAAAAAELGAVQGPSARVRQALERLSDCDRVLDDAHPWPGDLDRLRLKGGNGAALATSTCRQYADALADFRRACEHVRAESAHALLDRLLASFGERYTWLKRSVSGVDFEDLELLARKLLVDDADLREGYRRRFAHVMVDELQDTNAVQLELIDLVAGENVFMVGDAQQSIYGFRHADVELFEQRAQRLADAGRRLALRRNFRSRPEILEVLNGTFGAAMGERFTALVAARPAVGGAEGLVELLVAEKSAEWAADGDGLASPWRLAEARAVAARLRALTDDGAQAQQIVVLTRATGDLRAYERALEDVGVPTYVIGGRGYWEHPQVVDMVSYLRALANPRDELSLYTVLASPLVGTSLDALVVLAAAARASERDSWWVLREPDGLLDELSGEERGTLETFARWFSQERTLALRGAGVEELIEGALERSGYDLAVLAMRGGERRLANVRKLMRLGREHEALSGPDLTGFLDLVSARQRGFGGQASRESEAPVEGEALNAVRLMTIHRAKGLEFDIVCVADLGRGPARRGELMRVGSDGRFGLRLAQPGTTKAQPALDYAELGEERQRFEEQEERRLLYVAMTRARERLILSGGARLDAWPEGNPGTPIGWLAPALRGVEPKFVRPGDAASTSVPACPGAAPPSSTPDVDDLVRPIDALDRPGGETGRASAGAVPPGAAPPGAALPGAAPPGAALPGAALPSLSYSALEQYQRCGYRFYLERVLGVPGLAESGTRTGSEPARAGGPLDPTARGALVHALLERLDFRRPAVPGAAEIAAAAGPATLEEAEIAEIAGLIEAFAGSALRGRLARALAVRREQRFAFLLCGETLLTGAFDVLAWEEERRALVVDYKTDRLEGADPADVALRSYRIQRLVYALAALRSGAEQVEVVHVFLEAADRPAVERFSAADAARLAADLEPLSAGVRRREFKVAEVPHRALCAGCPAEGGLCSWPLQMTRREAPERLF